MLSAVVSQPAPGFVAADSGPPADDRSAAMGCVGDGTASLPCMVVDGDVGPGTDREAEINAITLVVTDMAASVRFYSDLGFTMAYGGPDADFTSLRVGANFINLQVTRSRPGSGWGRFILHVESPDAVYRRALDTGHRPLTAPADAPWGERYFHIQDPDGHEISFARPLDRD